MGCEYDATKWKFLLTHQSRGLQAVFLHNGNSFSSIPIEYLLQMKENHNTMYHFLSTSNFQKKQMVDLWRS